MSFRIGQTVVCINDAGQALADGTTPIHTLVKGHTYVVEAIRKGCCFGFLVDVGLPSEDPGFRGFTECIKCGKRCNGRWHKAVRFAPYEPLKDELDRLEEHEAVIEKFHRLFDPLLK